MEAMDRLRGKFLRTGSPIEFCFSPEERRVQRESLLLYTVCAARSSGVRAIIGLLQARLCIRLPPWMSGLGFDEACPKTPSFLSPQVADSTHSILVSFACPDQMIVGTANVFHQ
jgi:hypothetical protein